MGSLRREQFERQQKENVVGYKQDGLGGGQFSSQFTRKQGLEKIFGDLWIEQIRRSTVECTPYGQNSLLEPRARLLYLIEAYESRAAVRTFNHPNQQRVFKHLELDEDLTRSQW